MKRKLSLILVILLLFAATATGESAGYLAPTGDTSDRSGEIIDMLTRYGVCYLRNGDYYIKETIDMPNGSSIYGEGESTRLVLDSGTADIAILQCSRDNQISRIRFVDGNGFKSRPTALNTGVGHIGIMLISNSGPMTPWSEVIVKGNIKVSDCTFEGFGRAGVYGLQCGYSIDLMESYFIENCRFLYNNCGIQFDAYCEYSVVTNCEFRQNYRGVQNYGGNNKFSTCGFDQNNVGMSLADGSSHNGGHGTIASCTFCHNAMYGMYADGETHGFCITGTTMFDSPLYLKNTNGFTFTGCEFGGLRPTPTTITIEGGNLVLMVGCVFKEDAPRINVYANDKVHFVNCYSWAGGVAIAP